MLLQATNGQTQRRYPLGAELLEDGTSFRVWAPDRRSVSVIIEGLSVEYELRPADEGYFEAVVENVGAGARYRFRLDGGNELFADPASRYQPDGPGGPSVVISPDLFSWRDHEWRGVSAEHQVIYEMHVGTFTQEGTWSAAARQLERLADLGVTLIEMMPVNEFYGSFGWGYDGVLLFAPTHLYGEPDDLRSFVDRAHSLGIGVILDVVYNHFGVGDRFDQFTASYFTERYENEWGRSINFDGPASKGVRTYVAKNAAYWIGEFHFDGLRIDATQALFDSSEDHIIAEIARESRMAGGSRSVVLLAEGEPQQANLIRPQSRNGLGLDAAWNDDFHHSAMVALTGRKEAYYHDHNGSPQEFVSAAKYGYLFQGQRYDWQDHARGTPAFDLRAHGFVHFLQNHDQIANSGRGHRAHRLSAPGNFRAMTALLLLGPQTPMLFQGQEFGSNSPFLYFADHNDEDIAKTVRVGRLDFLSQFPSLGDGCMRGSISDPTAVEPFHQSKLDWTEFEENREIVLLHKDLLRLRRERLNLVRRVDGSVLGASAFLLRYFGPTPEEDHLLLVNLGTDFLVDSIPDPLFAPPAGCRWEAIWSSEAAAYDGSGVREVDFAKRWTLSGQSALFLAAAAALPSEPPGRDGLAEWQRALSA